MKQGIWTTLGAMGVVAAVSLSFPALAAAPDKSAVAVNDVIPILARAQTAEDQLPRTLEPGAFSNLQRTTVRSLGSDGTAQYWVARSGTSDVCLIAHIPEGSATTASSCGPITAFYRTGIALAVGENPDFPERSVQAYLLPQDVRVSDIASKLPSIRSAKYDIEANMFTMQWYDGPAIPAVEMRRVDGTDFNFAPIGRDE